MRFCKFLSAWVFVAVSGVVALAQPGGDKLAILETYQGTVANDKKPELKTGFIATEAEWKDVWAKVNPKDKLPTVDFMKHMLLITTKDPADPNKGSISVVKDDKGVLKIMQISTLIGFQPSGQTAYSFHKVAREGVTGVQRFDAAQKKMVVDPLPK